MTPVLEELERELLAAHQRLGLGRRRFGVRLTQRARRRLIPVPALVAAIVVVILVLSAGGAGSSVLARAYAATGSAGNILYYRTSTSFPGIDRPGNYDARVRSSSSVWESGQTVHVLQSAVIGGLRGYRATALYYESVTYEGRTRIWQGSSPHGSGGIIGTSGPLGPGTGFCASSSSLAAVSQCGGPLRVVRQLYRSGVLHSAGKIIYGGHEVDVLTGAQHFADDHRLSRVTFRVLVNARTFVPVLIQSTRAGEPTTTTTFSDFRHLGLTSANERHLRMRAHFGASVSFSGVHASTTLGRATRVR